MKLNAELTKRENEVAELLAWGAAKKEVADRLFISTELCVWWFCKKCGVPPSLDPLKRAFYALVLLAIFIPRELTANGDMFRAGRRTAKTARTYRASRRRIEDLDLTDFIKTTAI